MKKTLSGIFALLFCTGLLVVPVQAANNIEEVWSYEIIIPPKYDEAGPFSENGLAGVKIGNTSGYIDLNGDTVIPFRFGNAGIFSEGKAVINPIDWEQGKELGLQYLMNGIIDENGQIIGEPSLANYIDGNKYHFHNGFLAVNTDFGYAVYNPDGSVKTSWNSHVNPYKDFFVTGPYNEGLFPAVIAAGSDGFIAGWVDSDLNWIKTFERESNATSYISQTMTFHHGIAPVWQAVLDEEKGRYIHSLGFMNRDFEWVIEPLYEGYVCWDESEQICFSEDGIAIVKNEGKYGAIDLAGNTVIPFLYDKLQCASDGLVAYCQNETWGYLSSENGKVVVPACYSYAGRFSNGIAVVYDGERTRVIDTNGKEIPSLSQLDLTYYIMAKNYRGEQVYESKPIDEYLVIKENGLYGYAKLMKAKSVKVQPSADDGEQWVTEAAYAGDALILTAKDGVTASVFLAAYNESGRMAGVYTAECMDGVYTLPVGADAEKYEWKLMFVDAENTAPLTCSYQLDFTA